MIRVVYEQDDKVKKEFEISDTLIYFNEEFRMQKPTGGEALPHPVMSPNANTLPATAQSSFTENFFVFFSASTTTQSVWIPRDFSFTAQTSCLHPNYDPITESNHTLMVYGKTATSTSLYSVWHTSTGTFAPTSNADAYGWFFNAVPGALALITKGRTVA